MPFLQTILGHCISEQSHHYKEEFPQYVRRLPYYTQKKRLRMKVQKLYTSQSGVQQTPVSESPW